MGEGGRYQFSAKLICGGFLDKHLFSPGVYRTVVNIHNPNRETVPFTWQILVAGPVSEGSGARSERFEATIGAEEACFLDCEMAVRLSGMASGAHFDGWLVIETALDFDVVAVYTVQPSSHENAASLSTFRVEPRRIPPR